MRSIWKGSISFGLVSIAVKVYSATEEKDIAFHQVHREDGGRIKYKRTCSIDGEEVPYNDIAKGYELPDGDMVVLTDDDLAELPLTSSREIDVLQFVPLEQVDPIYFNKSYYLEPDPRAAKAYVLLRDTLEKSGRVAVVKVALRRREALATLRVRAGVITLETMLWPDEIRNPEFGFLDEDVDVRPAEIAMANGLVESLSGDFNPADYTDQYRAALESVVEAKIEGRDLVPAPDTTESEASGTVVDLVAALQASIAAVKASKEAGGGVAAKAAESAGRAGGKKAAVKKLPSKATPAKKAAATRAGSTKVAAKSAAAKTAAKAPAAAASRAAAERKPARARRSA
ncbi:MAG TPA: Ku protein, partial [Acidothermaceae bacterium]